MSQQINPNQPVETDAYVPTYKIKPEFKDAVMKAVGKYPYNKTAALINAINVEIMDHNTLTRVMQALGQFPYIEVAPVLSNINSYIEQVLDDDEEDKDEEDEEEEIKPERKKENKKGKENKKK